MLGDLRVEAVIPVSDVDRATSFYRDKLGLELMERRDELAENPMVRFRAGDSTLAIYKSVGAGQSRHTLANLVVPDVRAAVDAARERGVTFEEYDMPGIKTEDGIATVGNVEGAWFKDPDGNIIAIGSYR